MSNTILIADADKKILSVYKQFFLDLSFQVIVSASQKETESIIAKEKPGLAIFGLIMENDDSGFILAYKLKKKYPDVPIIILSSSTAKHNINFSLESDEERRWIKADAYFENTISLEQLQKEVMKLLKP